MPGLRQAFLLKEGSLLAKLDGISTVIIKELEYKGIKKYIYYKLQCMYNLPMQLAVVPGEMGM